MFDPCARHLHHHHYEGCAGGLDRVKVTDAAEMGKGPLVPEPNGPIPTARNVSADARPLNVNDLHAARQRRQHAENEKGKGRTQYFTASSNRLQSATQRTTSVDGNPHRAQTLQSLPRPSSFLRRESSRRTIPRCWTGNGAIKHKEAHCTTNRALRMTFLPSTT